MQELIVLVDEQGQSIGTAPKLASHHSNTPLHLAFSCYIFNDNGELLVTQRAQSKKVWPGVWTNSVCGHPAPNESFTAAIIRRAQFELGMRVRNITEILPDYRYKTEPFNGIIENEICPVYAARAASQPHPNSDEVASFRWMPWAVYVQELTTRAPEFSYWAKDQFTQLNGHPSLAAYIK